MDPRDQSRLPLKLPTRALEAPLLHPGANGGPGVWAGG